MLPEAVVGDSPTHGNYIVLLPSKGFAGYEQRQRFEAEARIMSVEVW